MSIADVLPLVKSKTSTGNQFTDDPPDTTQKEPEPDTVSDETLMASGTRLNGPMMSKNDQDHSMEATENRDGVKKHQPVVSMGMKVSKVQVSRVQVSKGQFAANPEHVPTSLLFADGTVKRIQVLKSRNSNVKTPIQQSDAEGDTQETAAEDYASPSTTRKHNVEDSTPTTVLNDDACREVIFSTTTSTEEIRKRSINIVTSPPVETDNDARHNVASSETSQQNLLATTGMPPNREEAPADHRDENFDVQNAQTVYGTTTSTEEKRKRSIDTVTSPPIGTDFDWRHDVASSESPQPSFLATLGMSSNEENAPAEHRGDKFGAQNAQTACVQGQEAFVELSGTPAAISYAQGRETFVDSNPQMPSTQEALCSGRENQEWNAVNSNWQSPCINDNYYTDSTMNTNVQQTICNEENVPQTAQYAMDNSSRSFNFNTHAQNQDQHHCNQDTQFRGEYASLYQQSSFAGPQYHQVMGQPRFGSTQYETTDWRQLQNNTVHYGQNPQNLPQHQQSLLPSVQYPLTSNHGVSPFTWQQMERSNYIPTLSASMQFSSLQPSVTPQNIHYSFPPVWGSSKHSDMSMVQQANTNFNAAASCSHTVNHDQEKGQFSTISGGLLEMLRNDENDFAGGFDGVTSAKHPGNNCGKENLPNPNQRLCSPLVNPDQGKESNSKRPSVHASVTKKSAGGAAHRVKSGKRSVGGTKGRRKKISSPHTATKIGSPKRSEKGKRIR